MLLFQSTLTLFMVVAVTAKIPAICYSACNDAYLERRNTGVADCTPGAPFRMELDACIDCILANRPGPILFEDWSEFGGVLGACIR
jgi:hypothetical protein